MTSTETASTASKPHSRPGGRSLAFPGLTCHFLLLGFWADCLTHIFSLYLSLTHTYSLTPVQRPLAQCAVSFLQPVLLTSPAGLNSFSYRMRVGASKARQPSASTV